MKQLLTTLSVLASLGVAAPALAAPPADGARPAYCQPASRSPKIFGIGGSTMGSALGPMLDHLYKPEGVAFDRWGKASSGLARPDFHDWPKEAPRLMQKHKPDMVVVSLGTNDYQAIKTKEGWIRQEETAAWEKAYADRVDALLEGLTADNKQRFIIWSGPYAFKGENAEARAPIVNRIMRSRVDAFIARGGRAVFLDAYALTSDGKGRPLSEADLPGMKGKQKIRQKDNIHLTTEAVRAFLADPVVALTRPCHGAKTASDKR
jgi:hypothetical protein